MLDPWLRHLAKELPGVGRERFDVPPLAFRVERVHGERRFAAAAGTAEDVHLLTRNLHIDVLEVVLRGAANGDAFVGEG